LLSVRVQRKLDCVDADRGAGQSPPTVKTEWVICWKQQNTASREKSLEGRNAQEGKGQTRRKTVPAHRHGGSNRWSPGPVRKEGVKGQERMERVSATDTALSARP
jgi:hypothetical protein